MFYPSLNHFYPAENLPLVDAQVSVCCLIDDLVFPERLDFPSEQYVLGSTEVAD